MNKTLFAACGVLMALASPPAAQGADLGNGSYKEDNSVAGTTVKWSGFYLGVEAGYGKANGDIATHSTRKTPAVEGQAGVPGKPGVAAIPGAPGAGRRGGEACNFGEPGCENAAAAVEAHAAGDECKVRVPEVCERNPAANRLEWKADSDYKPAVTGTYIPGASCNFGEPGCLGAQAAIPAHEKDTACYSEGNGCRKRGDGKYTWKEDADAVPAVPGRTVAGAPCVAGRDGCIGGSEAIAAVDAIPAIPAIAGVAASVLVQDDYSTISPAGMFGDITLGADFQGPGSNFVVGAFGNYAIGSIEANVGSGHDNITMSIDNQYQLGFRAGYLVTPTTLAYAKLGYSGGELNVTHTGAGEWSNPSLSGYTVGAGVETRLYGNLFARAEYDYTNYGENKYHTYSDATVTETSSVDLSEHAAKVGLIYKFGN